MDEIKLKKIMENIAILADGGKVCWNNHTNLPLTLVGIILDDGSNENEFDLNEFATLEEYIEPKTKEQELEERIAELEAQLKAKYLENYESKGTKPRVVLSETSQLDIAKRWKAEQASGNKMFLNRFAKEYNISASYLAKILKKFGVRKQHNRKQTVTEIDI